MSKTSSKTINNPAITSLISDWAPRPITKETTPALTKRVTVSTLKVARTKKIRTITAVYLIKLATRLTTARPFFKNLAKNLKMILTTKLAERIKKIKETLLIHGLTSAASEKMYIER